MGTRLFVLFLGLVLLATLRSACADPTYVRFNTNLGYINVELLSDDSPNTVANFLTYVDSGAYNNSIIHRSVPSFIFQGGGYYLANNNTITPIPANAPVVGEHVVSNTRGTLAMALSTGPNSGTNQWFFNEVDNSSLLDGTADGGPFTVFGVVADTSSLSIMDQIANVSVYDASTLFGAAFSNLPLINYNSTLGLQVQNLVMVYSITRLTVQDFTAWQTANSLPVDSGPTATPQNDGVPNLLKYLCDLNPSGPMSAADRAKLPTLGKATIGGMPYMTLTYQQYTSLVGVTINVQTSPDLQTWTTVTNPTIVQTGTNSATGDPIMQIQVPVAGATEFIRLNVTQP